MSYLLNLLDSRKSIRKYENRSISRSKIISCIEAARLSPSACNIQPWQFVVIDSAKVLRKITNTAFAGIYYPNKFACSAPVLIAVIARPDKTVGRMANYIHGDRYYLFDVGFACSNLILRAKELKLGSCVIAWFDHERVKKVLKISPSLHVIALIAIGYASSDGKKTRASKNRKKIANIMKFNVGSSNR